MMDNIYLLLTHQVFLLLLALIVITVIVGWLFYRRYQQRNRLLLHNGGEQATHTKYDEYRLTDDGQLSSEDPLFDEDDVAIIETPEPEHAASKPPTQQALPKDLILVLYIIAQDEQGFNGLDIFAVLEELGLRHGAMQIFHHYGLGDAQAKQSVFSVASMMEPGILKRENVEQFFTPGLVFFMQLPGPVGGRVAFELMLSQMHKVAEELNGQLENDRHEPLTSEITDALRARIAEFEQW